MTKKKTTKKTLSFEEKVKAMTPKQIIMAMVKGLEKPKVKINMSTFGDSNEKGVCFGCAATNTICQINGMKFTAENIYLRRTRAEFLKSNTEFLSHFEHAIDRLRVGIWETFGGYISDKNIINPNNIELPYLNDNYTKEDLEPYIQLANDQPE